MKWYKPSLFIIHYSLFIVFAGCQSYRIVQRNVFSDEDGFQVTVDYGRSDTDHVNTFRSPANGKEMEFKSRLMVKVELPDGDTFKAWQCMNFQRQGTMYKTDDERMMALLTGFSCVVYERTKADPTKYLEIYRGVLCESPKIDVEKDERWKTIKK